MFLCISVVNIIAITVISIIIIVIITTTTTTVIIAIALLLFLLLLLLPLLIKLFCDRRDRTVTYISNWIEQMHVQMVHSEKHRPVKTHAQQVLHCVCLTSLLQRFTQIIPAKAVHFFYYSFKILKFLKKEYSCFQEGNLNSSMVFEPLTFFSV